MPHHRTPDSPHRFYCPSLADAHSRDVSDAWVQLDKPESHHARNVLRLSVGASVVLFDGRGVTASAHIQNFEFGRAVCRIESLQRHEAPGPTLTVASAAPKGPRADAMVDQLSQLGVDVFVPLVTDYSVATPRDSKLDKFRRSAIESAKQCGRAWLMQVSDTASPEAVWSDQVYDLKLLTEPGGGGFKDLAGQLNDCNQVLILIGPEGGWSEEERASAKQHGCVSWTFAPHILRIETAATAAAAILRSLTVN